MTAQITPLREAMGMAAGTFVLRRFVAQVFVDGKLWISPERAPTYELALRAFASLLGPPCEGRIGAFIQTFDLSDPEQLAHVRRLAVQIAEVAPECAR